MTTTEELVSEGRKLHNAWFDGPDMKPRDRMIRLATVAREIHKPRTLTTEAELHSLRDGSAVCAAGHVHIKNGRWVDRLGEFSPAWLLLEMGAVTVLYEDGAA